MYDTTPFSTKPIDQDERFHDQIAVMEKILKYLKHGRSCAVVGGYGMGKTSILKHLQRKFLTESYSSPIGGTVIIPIYFCPDPNVSMQELYRHLLMEMISQTDHWFARCVEEEESAKLRILKHLEHVKNTPHKFPADHEGICNFFEILFWTVLRTIEPAIRFPRFVLLFDGLEEIVDQNVACGFIRHWLALHNEDKLPGQDLKPSFCMVIAGSLSPFDQLNQLQVEDIVGLHRVRDMIDIIYLSAFRSGDAFDLIKRPFSDDLDADFAECIYGLTGGHPRLVQSVMTDIWSDYRERLGVQACDKKLTVAQTDDYIATWMERSAELCRWINARLAENDLARRVIDILTDGQKYKKQNLIKILREQVIHFNPGALHKALNSLLSYGLLQEVEHDTFCLTVGSLLQEQLELMPGKKEYLIKHETLVLEVRKLLGDDNLPQALAELEKIPILISEVTDLRRRLNETKEHRRHNTLPEPEISARLSSITYDILDLISMEQ